MLSARKLHLAAGLKVRGLSLRQAELDFYMLRYVSVTGVAALQTGLSYVGLIKIKIPDGMEPPSIAWEVLPSVCTSLTMCLSLFNVAVGSFLVVNAQGLMLRGPPDSVARCVNILGGYWPLIRNVLMLSLVTLVGAAMSIAWMKLVAVPLHPGPAVWCTALVALICAVAACKMAQLSRELSIGREDLVEGDLTISTASGAQIDIMAERSANIPIATR